MLFGFPLVANVDLLDLRMLAKLGQGGVDQLGTRGRSQIGSLDRPQPIVSAGLVVIERADAIVDSQNDPIRIGGSHCAGTQQE